MFKSTDHFKVLEDKIKFYITEIITLRALREEQDKVITKLREENLRLKKEVERLKSEEAFEKV